jgi:hypothetical protein
MTDKGARAGASACLPPDVPSRWRGLVQLCGRDAIGSPGGTHPLAVDGQTAYACWTQVRPGGAEGIVHLSRSPDCGVSWSLPAPVTSGEAALYPCSLEIGTSGAAGRGEAGSILHLVWPDSRNRDLWEPYYKRSTDEGRTWSPEVRLCPGADLFRVGTAASGLSLHVVWSNKLLLEKVPAGDQTWTWAWGEI